MAKNDTPLSKHLPKPELGMFVSDLENANAARASAAVAAHVSRDSLHPVADADRQLLEITRLYWADKAYDEAASIAEVRDQIEPAIEKALATAKALGSLSKATKVAFVSELHRHRAFEVAFIDKLIAHLEKFSSLATPLAQAENGSRSQEALKGCCIRLMKFREKMTGKPFKATLAPKLGVGDATMEFQRPDPQFVLEIAKAIDPDLRFPAVRSAFVMLAKERKRKKQAQK